MEQGVPGSQNEHFFELLHPNATRGSPPPPPPPPPPPATSSVDAAADGSPPPQDASPVHDITPSYDFHLTHPAKAGEISAKLEDPLPVLHRPSSLTPTSEHLQGSSIDTSRGLVYGKPIDATDAADLVTMDAIERSIKQHTDRLMDAFHSVNGRLFQLETMVQGLQQTIAGLKSTEGEKQDQSNSRLTKLELMLEEVRRGVQFLYEKPSMDGVNSHMANLRVDEQKSAVGGLPQTPAEGWQQPKTAKEEAPQVAFSESPPQLPQHVPSQYPAPTQAHYPPPPPLPQIQAYTTQSIVPLPSTMNVPPAANQQPYPPAMQHISPQQPSSQTPQPPQNSLHVPAFHSQPAPQLPPPSSYNVPIEATAYSHMQPQHHLPPTLAPPSSTYLPEPPHYTGGMHGGPRQPPLPQEGLHSSQQQHNPVGSQLMYDPVSGRMAPTATSMAPSYAPPPPMPKPAPSIYETSGGGGGGYSTSPYRTAQPMPSAPSGGGSGYPRLPTAQPIQHGLPAANPVSSGPSTRSSLDDVVERVHHMGFPREQVRGVVRQLTDHGQSVELNVVLDKLMNGGDSSQPARGWFNRG